MHVEEAEEGLRGNLDGSNLDGGGIARRRTLGWIALVGGLLLGVGTILWAGSPWWRLATGPVFFFALLALLQARDGV